jgi:manganese/zinc/iron transport system permease protein
MVVLGVVIAVTAGLAGTAAAYVLGVTISGTVAVVMGLTFAATLVASPRHGLVAQWLRRARQRREFFETMLAIHLRHHEGTAEEPEECRLATLHEHMNWPVPAALAVARRVVNRGWADERDGRLILTEAGREAARAAVGRPSPAGG